MTLENVKELEIPVTDVMLKGLLGPPYEAKGMVVFAHGSGSSRLSSRNNYVAEVIRERGLGTLLFDLLTEQEDLVYENRFNIPLLTDRLVDVTHWLADKPEYKTLKMGYFGASTGAAAALKAAARLGNKIGAVVSRGGRPDLATPTELAQVQSPTLLIVGGFDDIVIGMNKDAYADIACVKQLKIIPGATHLFEEPGALEQAAMLASDWFVQYLR
ncbi:MAG: hypothetical protein BMS9Abin33_0245 [Gammaproteobacteria bacterium]|nr:MAG: hypothetical protein BMS9Abin33_0245 [Gammaproteobacteria bacterium]